MLRRGFSHQEITERIRLLQENMRENRIDAILLSTEHDIRYYSNFHTQFWQSLTRPWFLIIPVKCDPIAVIPSIGKAGMERTPIQDIRTWPAPNPSDDGVSLLVRTLLNLPKRYGRLGVPMGEESFLKMPLAHWQTLTSQITFDLVDVQRMILSQRMVKSETEIAKIRFCAETSARLMHQLAQHIHKGMSQQQICQLLRKQLIEAGIDHSPFLIAGSGQGGYADIIMGPDDTVPKDGDVLIIDTGSQYDGYFCDFDRNYGFGNIAKETLDAHERLWQATEFVFSRLYGGIKALDIARMFSEQLGQSASSVGRVGHGLGMGLTEWPSLHPEYDIPLPSGTVITLEPAYSLDENRMLVHEENVLIKDDGAELLSIRAPQEMLRIN